MLWGALQDAEAGRQAQYLLEVALPLELEKEAGVGGRVPKGTALGGREEGREQLESPVLPPGASKHNPPCASLCKSNVVAELTSVLHSQEGRGVSIILRVFVLRQLQSF